jgi:uncharacterized protein YciI
MKYAVFHQYAVNPELTAQHRPAHRAYLSTLVEENRVVLGGPFTDDSGALIVYEADSPESVEMMIKGDPFFVAGVFQTWTLKPWKTVFANLGLLPLN